MVDVFKKYALELAQEEKTKSLDPVVKLKKAIVGSVQPDFMQRPQSLDPTQYQSITEYQAAGGQLSAGILDYYDTLQNRADIARYIETKEEQRIREENAWVNDANAHTLTGTVINSVAAATNIVNRIEKNIATFPDTFNADINLKKVPDEAVAIWAKASQGEELTPEENAFLDTSPPIPSKRRGRGARKGPQPFQTLTYRERLQRADKSLERAEMIAGAFDNSPIVENYNPVRRNKLIKDLTQSYQENADYFENAEKAWNENNWSDLISNVTIGVGKLVAAGGTDLLSNPAATMEFVTEQAPYLVAGAYSKTLLGSLNVGYATDIYREKLTEHKNEFGGVPSKEERGELLAWSMTAAIAEQVGDLAILRAFRTKPGLSKRVTKLIEKTPDALQKLANNAVTRIGATTLKTGAIESATEIYQTAVEESDSNPFDGTVEGKNLFIAGTLGFAAGGVFAGAGATIKELSKIPEKVINASNPEKPSLRTNKNLTTRYAKEAIETGDVSRLVNFEDSRTYNPVQAAIALGKRAVNQVIDKDGEKIEITPKQQEQAKQQLEEIGEATQQRLVDLKEQLANSDNKSEKKKLSRLIKEADWFHHSVKSHIDAVDTALQVTTQTIEKTSNIVEAALSEEVTPENQQAGEKAVQIYAMTPSLITQDQLNKLLESKNVSKEGKEFIKDVQVSYSAIHAWANSKKTTYDVKSSVFNGDRGFKGLLEYERDIRRALRNNNDVKAVEEIKKLREFADDHSLKLKAAEAAYALAVKTKSPTYIYRENDKWKAKKGANTPWDNRQQQGQLGGFAFVRRKDGNITGKEFVSNINEEINAIESLGKAMASTIRLVRKDVQIDSGIKFNPKVQQETELSPEIGNINSATKQKTQKTEQATTAATTANVNINQATTPSEAKPEAKGEEATSKAKLETKEKETISEVQTQTEQIAPETETTKSLPEAVEQEIVEENAPETPSVTEESQNTEELSEATNDTKDIKKDTEVSIFNALPETNNLYKWFTQRNAKEKAKTKNPLVFVSNFMTQLFEALESEANLDVLNNFLANPITEKQAQLFGVFQRYFPNFIQIIDQGLGAPKNEKFLYEDLIKEFGEVVPENVKTAISMAAFLWVKEDGGRTSNFNSDINSILKRDSKTTVFPEERRVLGVEPLVRQSTIANQLGKRITALLNIQAKPNTPRDKIVNLQTALGNRAIQVLLESGLARRDVLTDDILYQDREGGFDPRLGGQPFIRIYHENPEVQEIVETGRKTGQFFENLFGIEENAQLPADKPGKFNQETTKGKVKVPTLLKNILKKVSKRKQLLNIEIKNSLDKFSEKTLQHIAGVRFEEDGWIHEANKESVKASNKKIIRDIKNWQDFAEEQENIPFYLRPVVWINQRVGLKHTVMNPQTSTVHRHVMYPEEWATTVNPNNSSDIELMFKIAVVQSMGFPVDKRKIINSLNHFDELLNDPVITQALEAINRNEPLEGDEQLIIAAVKKGKENLWSFHGLYELAQYIKGEEFESRLMVEVDGVTNGPALTNIMLGVANTQFGLETGFIQKEVLTSHPYLQNFSAFKEEGYLDLYEKLAYQLERILLGDSTKLNDIQYFVGNFTDTTGRNRVKTPLQSLIFGASSIKAVDNMAREFIKLYYEAIENSANSSNFRQQQEILTRINRLLGSQLQIESIDQVLNFQQEKKLINEFKNAITPALEKVLDDQYGDLQKRRKHLYAAGDSLFKVYNAIYQYEYQKRLKARIEDGNIRVVNNKPIDDLTAEDIREIEDSIAETLPVIHTPLSRLGDFNDRRNGIRLAVQGRTETNSDSLYFQKSNFGKTINNSFDRLKKKGTTSILSRGERDIWDTPGVRVVVNAMHSLDSAISSLTYNEFNGLNLHDAVGFSLSDAVKGGQALNKNTFRQLINYSLPLELLASLEKTYNIAETLSNNDVELNNFFKSLNLESEIIELGDFAARAYKMEIQKLEFLLQVEIVSQYSFDSSEYKLTIADIKAIRKKLAKRKEEFASRFPQFKKIESFNKTEFQNHTTFNPNGEEAIPVYRSDNQLMDLMVKKGKISAKKLLPILKKRIKETGSTPELINFENKLLNALQQVIDPNLEIRLITKQTSEIPQSENIRNTVGFFNPKENYIGIKSDDFRISMLTTETLLHELIHAGTWATVEGVQNGTITDPEIIQAVENIEALRIKAKAYIEQNNLEFGNSTSSIDEMITWGLTNADFQEKVLAQIQLSSEESVDLTNQVKKSGFRDFIRSLAKLIFKNRANAANTTALGSLVANSAILIKAITPVQKKDDAIFAMEPGNTAFSFSPEQIFDVLHTTSERAMSSEYVDYLKGMLRHISDAVFQDGAYKERVVRSTPTTPEDFYLNALNGNPVFPETSAELGVSQQELYVMSSVQAALEESFKLNRGEVRSVKSEAWQLWKYARKTLKNASYLYDGNWNGLSEDRQQEYEKAYALLFSATPTFEGRSEFLSRFMAASVAYAPLSQALSRLQVPTKDLNFQGMSLKERFDRIAEVIWEQLNRWFAGMRNSGNYREGAARLVTKLVQIEKKRQYAIERRSRRPLVALEEKGNQVIESVQEAISSVLQTDVLRNSGASIIRATSKLADAAINSRVVTIMDGIKQMRDGALDSRLGPIGQAWVEIRGDDNWLAQLTQMLSTTKTVEQLRKRVSVEVHQETHKAFESLSPEESKALTKLLLRLDVQVLTNNHSLEDIQVFISNDLARKNRIQELESRLPTQFKDYYTTQASALGKFMATGLVKSDMLMRNAHNIAFMYGLNIDIRPNTQTADNAKPIIDELATLYGIEEIGSEIRDKVSPVMERELNRIVNENGIEYVLGMHKQLQQEAYSSLFDSTNTQIVKGYTKDTYNPYLDVLVVNERDSSQLDEAGYTAISSLFKDPSDPRAGTFALYVAKTGGLSQHITGIMSNTTGHRQGTTVVGNLRNNQGDINRASVNNLQWIAANKEDALQAMLDGTYQINDAVKMIPVLDNLGNIINWRYMMSEAARDLYLERNNDVGKVIGNIASSIIDKSKTPVINRNAVDALKNMYDQNYINNSQAYITFGPNSEDPGIRERYALLPEPTKQYIRQIWGNDSMRIRNDTYNIMFGYRKAGVKDIFNKDPEFRSAITNTIIDWLGQIELQDENGNTIKRVPKSFIRKLIAGEAVWQEIVTMVKDIWVIKNLFTLLGNESSNLTILMIHGINPIKAVKQKGVATAATREYIHARQEKEHIERLIERNYLQGSDLEAAQNQVNALTEIMNNNPVNELMDLGMYQTLVEDVSQEEDPYSYQSWLSEQIENKTQWVPKGIKSSVKTLLITHDTSLYKILNNMTVLSDFTSRYVLNEHLKSKDLTLEERQQRIRDAFIDYDIPTSKLLQYLNDMGLVWFSKYYMRIQHVILTMIKENPLRALQVWVIFDYLISLPDILDSTFWNKNWGSAVGVGAFEMLDAPAELITLKAIDTVI